METEVPLVAGVAGPAPGPGGWLWAHGGAAGQHPPLTPGDWLTTWTFDPWLAVFVAVVAGLYLMGVRRLRERGDRWPVWRSLCFLGLGLGSIVVATQSVLAVYDDVLVTPHMIQHMILAMLAPIFLALGAPLTLALRTLPRRPRGWLVRLLHSRVAKVVAFPVVGGMLFVLTPFVLYFTGWYEASLRSLYLHEVLHLHFLLVGCLWFWPLLGLDPVPGRLPYPLRLLATFTTMPFHAFLGITIMGGNLLAEEYYVGLARTWGPSLVDDQRTAGGLLWAGGDLVAFMVMAVLFVQWVQASEREAAREDRRLDMLERAGQREGERGGRTGLEQASGADRDQANLPGREQSTRQDAASDVPRGVPGRPAVRG
ncbi:MAG: cytochrome c oxidase assembly protein [Actinomycetes bacterium]